MRKSISLLLVALLACDPYEGELPNQFEFKQAKFYSISGSSTVIDLKKLIKKSFLSMSAKAKQRTTCPIPIEVPPSALIMIFGFAMFSGNANAGFETTCGGVATEYHPANTNPAQTRERFDGVGNRPAI
jgi:hypothetical protein